MSDPRTDLEINCTAQLSLLEACRADNPELRIVFAEHAPDLRAAALPPGDEGHPLDPVDVNGINKTAGEWYHLLYGRVYGLPVSVLRLTNTYGPRMRVRDARQTFLGLWIRQALADEELLVFGDGAQRRDFSYVDDVVRALCLAATARGGSARCSTSGAATTREPPRRRSSSSRHRGLRPLPHRALPRGPLTIDIGDYYADDTKLAERSAGGPSVPLEQGLARRSTSTASTAPPTGATRGGSRSSTSASAPALRDELERGVARRSTAAASSAARTSRRSRGRSPRTAARASGRRRERHRRDRARARRRSASDPATR